MSALRAESTLQSAASQSIGEPASIYSPEPVYSQLLSIDELGSRLPFLDQSLADLVRVREKLSAPFSAQLQGDSELDAIRDQLESLGFQVDYLDLLPDENNNLLRASYSREWTTEEPFVDFGFDTGFDYFDSAVDGELSGKRRGNSSSSDARSCFWR